jgi:transposase
MKKTKTLPKAKVIFKAYDQSVMPLIPPSWDEYISKNHPVRIVNSVIEKIDIAGIKAEYRGGGRATYNPRMLLKLIVYGYLNNIYSSRKLEAFASESIHCMWLTSLQKPDHNTINRFRSERLKRPLKKIFCEVVKLLIESNHVSLQEVYIDGTKIEANANKYTFVWGKTIKNNKEKIGSQLEQLWGYAESVCKEEMQQKVRPDFAEVAPAMIEETIKTIEDALREKEIKPEIKKKLSYAKKQWPGKARKYEQQEEILGDRNSYSKTDNDATFMRMKEDQQQQHGQLKAGYNVQIGTNNQIVVDYSIHQKASDTTTLPSQIEGMIELYGKKPERIIADAGYGSQENYEYLESKGITGYVKYNMFDREEKGRTRGEFAAENLYYNKEKDCYYCPMGQQMSFKEVIERQSINGYQKEIKVYQAENCNGCPMLGACHKAEGNRKIEINEQLNKYREKARELLKSEKGIACRKNRCVEVEPVFGNIKQNKGFKRFLLRGIEKVAIETGLIFLAHNLKKAWALNLLSVV